MHGAIRFEGIVRFGRDRFYNRPLIANSKHQYEKAFKHWHWSKNDSSSFWDAVCVRLFRLRNRASKLEVFRNGDEIDDAQVQSQMKRRSAAFFQRHRAPTSLPNGVAVLSRNDRTSTVFVQLPFHIFMETASATERSSHYEQRFVDVSANSLEEISSPDSSLLPSTLTRVEVRSDGYPLAPLYSNPNQARVLEAVTFPVLATATMSHALKYRLDTQMDISVHHWQTLLSIANNFAGLSGLDVQLFFRFLRNEMGQFLRALVRRSPTCCTTRSIVCNILKASIGVGDAETIGFILAQGIDDINVNNLVCSIRGFKCTALEKAISLGHTDVVKALLHHGASVWLSEPHRKLQNPRNALDVFLEDNVYSVRFGDCDEILSLLMRAGGKVSCSTLKKLTDNKEIGLVYFLLENDMVLDKEQLVREAVIQTAMKRLDEDACLKILRHLDYAHSDIDLRSTDHDSGWYLPPTLLEAAVRWEFVRVVEELLKQGATIHRPALMYALRNDEKDMTTILFDYQARFDLHPQGSKSCGETQDLGSSRPSAVPDDDATVEMAGLSDSEQRDEYPESPLLTAIKAEQFQQAETLIDSGVDVNPWGGSPLEEALIKRNAAMVSLLLDAGADPNRFGKEHSYDGHSGITAIDLAVRWGDHAIIQGLIEAGASRWGRTFIESGDFPALVIAVLRSDTALVRLLLHSVVSPDLSVWTTAIQGAVYGDNVQMVRLLLSSGVYEKDESWKYDKFGAVIFYYSSYFTQEKSLEEKDLANAEIFDQRSQQNRSGGKEPNKDSASETSLASDDVADSNIKAADPKAAKKSWYEYCRYEIGAAAIHPRKLDLRRSSKEICDLILDSFKVRNFPLYEQIILDNLYELILSPWSDKYHDFTQFMDDRWLDVSAAASATEEFGRMYYVAIVKAKYGEMFFLQKLLEHGCGPHILIQDRFSFSQRPHLTAFLGAICTGNTDIVKLFIKHKADVNFAPRLNVKRTPLQQAASCGHLDVVKLLITHGASINAPAARFGGATALQFAAIGGYHAIIDLLINYGAEVDAPAAKRDGRTALEGAAEHGRTDTVKVLLNAGAANNGRDRAQIESAITYADDKGHPYICDMLREHLDGGKSKNASRPPGTPRPFDEFFDWSRWDKNALPTT